MEKIISDIGLPLYILGGGIFFFVSWVVSIFISRRQGYKQVELFEITLGSLLIGLLSSVWPVAILMIGGIIAAIVLIWCVMKAVNRTVDYLEALLERKESLPGPSVDGRLLDQQLTEQYMKERGWKE